MKKFTEMEVNRSIFFSFISGMAIGLFVCKFLIPILMWLL